MMIADVIREADTEHEIYFLLTSYVEAVRYFDKFNMLPAGMRDLPITSFDDVTARVEGLGARIDGTDVLNRPVIKEAMEIFVVARDRLGVLERGQRRLAVAA
jgi:hypothetical protein